jgi:hypothetical protein
MRRSVYGSPKRSAHLSIMANGRLIHISVEATFGTGNPGGNMRVW